MTIETYDMVMLAVLLIATAIGAWKGLVWQVASLVSLLASYWVAHAFRDACAAYIPVDSPWNVPVAMLGLFVLTLLGIWMIFHWLAAFIERLKLKAFDRQLGALLGFVKGLILCVVITLLAVTLLGDDGRRSIAESKSGFLLSIILDESPELLPAEIQEMVRPYLDAVNERLEDAAEQGGGSGLTGGIRCFSRPGRLTAGPDSMFISWLVVSLPVGIFVDHRVEPGVTGNLGWTEDSMNWRREVAAGARGERASVAVVSTFGGWSWPAKFNRRVDERARSVFSRGKLGVKPNIRNIIGRCGEANPPGSGLGLSHKKSRSGRERLFVASPEGTGYLTSCSGRSSAISWKT